MMRPADLVASPRAYAPPRDAAAPSDALSRFFSRYAQGVRTFDPAIVTAAYAESYVSASPVGCVCARNDAAFREAFAPWRARFEALGFRTADIRSVRTTTLDDHLTLARVGWLMRFERAGEPVDVCFDETYLLHQCDDQAMPRIVLSISHTSEEETLRAAGLGAGG